MAGKKYFNVNGKAFSAVEIKSFIQDAYAEEVEKTVDVVVKETEKLVEKMTLNSALRGRGRHAARYNAPLQGANVVVKKLNDGKYLVIVDNETFRRIDEGRKALSKSSGKPMRFPVYDGTMTTPGSLNISRAVVADKPKWVSTREVKAVRPRNLLQQIVDKKAYLRPPEPARRTRNPFRFRFSRNEISVRIVTVTKRT